MYTIIIAIVKVSILYLYMTIFVPHKRGSFYYVIHLLIWSNVIYYFITTVFYMNEVRQLLIYSFNDPNI